MDDVSFRQFCADDLSRLKEIMVEAFDGVSIDQGIEQVFGEVAGHDWKWRKARHLDQDVERDARGIIVAEQDDRIIGFISTWMDMDAGIGHIPNISLVPECRGHGIGRGLIAQALDRFRSAGMSHAKIETLEQNGTGNHLYTDVGFREVARQVHFVADLNADEPNA